MRRNLFWNTWLQIKTFTNQKLSLFHFFCGFQEFIYIHVSKANVCSYHVTYTFQIESTLYSCLNVKELLARSRREIWNLSDCNRTQTHNHLVHKRRLNHLAKLANMASLAKWLSLRLWTKWLWVRVLLQSLNKATLLLIDWNKYTSNSICFYDLLNSHLIFLFCFS